MISPVLDKNRLGQSCAATLLSVRNHAPLVHNITNFVVMHTTANALLAVGASPIMAHAPEEMHDISQLADALVLNIGTLDSLWILSMRQAARFALERDIPIVLDPVGAGASMMRTETAQSFLTEIHPNIVRGNASEIMALNNTGATAKGVDSLKSASEAVQSASALSFEFGCVTCVSGEKDIITDGPNCVTVAGGNALMTRVTGMGCTSTAITAACAAGAKKAGIDAPDFVGAVTAMAIMAEAGETAAARCQGPGSFLSYFLDALYRCDPNHLEQHIETIQLD